MSRFSSIFGANSHVVVGLNREGVYRDAKSTVTYNFTISEGGHQVHPEVMLTNSGLHIIEHRGKKAKEAARLALERILMTGRNPFYNPVLLRVPDKRAEYFAMHGDFHQRLRFKCQ